MRSILLAAIASIGLVACVGELDTTGGGGGGTGGGTGGGSGSGSGTTSLARTMYENNVHSIMTAKCIGCHRLGAAVGNLSGFVDDNKATSHATIIGFTSVVGSFAPTTAPVLLKISAGHQGTSYSQTESAAITEWLNQEVIEQNGGGGGSGSGSGTTQSETPAQASQRVLANWSACMTKANFDTANMAQSWGTQMTANNNQRCSNCHASGDGGFIATPDSTLMFDVMSTNKYYMLQYFRVKLDLANLQNSKIEINMDSFMGVSQGQDPHREHPRFNATTNVGMEALQTFYTSTAAAVAAGNCGPSKLLN